MVIDLVPSSGYDALPVSSNGSFSAGMSRAPRIVVFDSGLGGLTVFSEVRALRPDADYLYVADDAGFPYGGWPECDLVARVLAVVGEIVVTFSPDVVVVACNTASTLVLPDLRAAHPSIQFVGTVPAIKPAAALSRTKRISVLATPGTVARDYTRGLVESFAADCRVTLVGSTVLAELAEAAMAGVAVDDDAIAAEIAPCFVADAGGRTDCVVLACTHYPLLRDRLERLSPWPVTFIDPAPAIARRVDAVLAAGGSMRDAPSRLPAAAMLTSGKTVDGALAATFARFDLSTLPPRASEGPARTAWSECLGAGSRPR